MKKANYIFTIVLILASSFKSMSKSDIVLEAETGILNGVEVSTVMPGYYGTGFVMGFDGDGDNVIINFESNKEGLYEALIRYSSPMGHKGFHIDVDGVLNEGSFDSVKWSTTSGGKYYLPKGKHYVKIIQYWGHYNIDQITFTPAKVPPPIIPVSTLSNPNATSSTKNLYAYLLSIYGKKTLSGVADFEAIKHAEKVSGKEVAVAGFDFMDYSPSRVEYGSMPQGVTESFIEWAKHGNGRGIVTMLWHWNAPTDLVNESPNKEWFKGFFTEATKFDFQAALADPSSNNYKLIVRDIDSIASQLKKFQAEDIPVLWRPLHEAEGTWFWWGSKGPEAFKQLWYLVHDRLTNHHKLNNLIWVFTTGGNTAWYPGDAYVDIVVRDIYSPPSSNMCIEWDQSQSMLKRMGSKKMLALAETGNLPDPNKIKVFGTKWAYFANWGGWYFTNQSEAVIKETLNHEDVITLDELPNWKAGSKK